ncbi:MAG: site-specific DNA-methyltransferase [Rhodobacter sp.]|nr:site-specific DNA-methyltransferase [Rhodobacter sp.]MCA3459955.1 site-specific DNA-methyltransferase [Rhodobacter sp.]MCA3465514.1 site-specific DNA-methyltransferase [Rhodobacter sp.]MCA3467563.1 site-specific DNA-methyltransferase [Rhodobacter sp.]MCA3471677.1 site-specific DNA-methyltransferase [Rhodobacter sp.]
MTDLHQEAVAAVVAAALDRSTVSGATHKFYRYPARFSPKFVRAVIEAFTAPGDLVLDPFIGGGTTAVEALRAGRRCIGTDINELALFVSKVKTTTLTATEMSFLLSWFDQFERSLKVSKSAGKHSAWRAKGYFRHLESQEIWRHRNLIEGALAQIDQLHSERMADFVRCVLLRSMQLSLDGRRTVMTVHEVRSKISSHFHEMIQDIIALNDELEGPARMLTPTVIKCNAAELHKSRNIVDAGPPKLVVTSPPYPGVHVLYHRWQVKGRRETAAPYWIANKLDGDGERYYTLGNRHEAELKTYFENLKGAFSSIAQVSGQDTIVVQMVAFSEPEWQLRKYLEVMEEAGLTEVSTSLSEDQRIWRNVPHRKWHAEMQTRREGSREVVLFHRKA